MKNNNFKSGFVALLGKPNVGKSTLLNYFLKEKISIVSAKPQTTRDNLRGIFTTRQYQIVFVDTPGMHNPKSKLGRHMVRAASEAGSEADEIIIIVDAAAGINDDDRRLFSFLKTEKNVLRSKWTAVLLNKIDLVKKQRIPAMMDVCRKELECDDYLPVSAVTGENLGLVLKKIIEFLPPGPAYYPEEQLTDKNERYIVAELIREQVLRFCREEVPHSVAVEVEVFKDSPGRKTLIQAVIFIEKKSQKQIIIGKEGQMLKNIGSAARLEIEKFLNRGVYLELWVKVQENWRRDECFLRRLGYEKF